MRGFKPDPVIWARINQVILGENAASVTVTMIGGLCQVLIASEVVADEDHARAHLAALLLSPDHSEKPGSLLPLLQAEIAKLSDGKWLQ